MITTLGFRLLLFVTLFLVGLKAVPELGQNAPQPTAYAGMPHIPAPLR